MNSPPVFLIGAERSGTTLLRLMLDGHPEIAFNPESEYLVTRISEHGQFPDLEAYKDWLGGDRVFMASRFEITLVNDYRELLHDFLMQLQTRTGKPIVGATVHYDFAKLRLIWPHAKYIYLLRDGRDVAHSVLKMGWAGNCFAAAGLWIAAEQEWASMRPTLSVDHWIEVRYESLVADVGSELHRICAFLGVGYSERMFDYVNHTQYGLPSPNSGGQWRNGMNRRDVQLVESRISGLLTGRGYQLSNLPPIQVGVALNAALMMQSRVLRYLNRLMTFGTSLTLQETLSRRLHLKKWNSHVSRQIDRQVTQRLK